MSDWTPTTKQVKEQFTREEPPQIGTVTERGQAFDRWLEQLKVELWDEGYWQGVEDERTAEALQVDIGLSGHATPNRANPYRKLTLLKGKKE